VAVVVMVVVISTVRDQRRNWFDMRKMPKAEIWDREPVYRRVKR